MIIVGSAFPRVMSVLASKLSDADQLLLPEPGRGLKELIGEAEVLVLGGYVVGRDVLALAPRLRLIHQQGRGVERLDLKAAHERGIQVCNVVGHNAVSVAEHCFFLMLHLAKRMSEMQDHVARRIVGSPAVQELRGRTLGLVGYGASGVDLARRARAFGMTVIATRRSASERRIDEDGVEIGGPGDLHALLERSDFVSLHCPLDDSTRNMIDRAALARMKPGAYLINVARAGLCDYPALVEALSSKQLAGAAFDVFWTEPAEPADPILALPNFVLTPHVAGFSEEAIEVATDAIAANVERLRRGLPLESVVGPIA